ncbi:MAG: fibronectin type III domain-containing protein, partial [Clostridia bacterium]|nr:fibronectin type III domain-containing protein [Clostridia bacterium]
ADGIRFKLEVADGSIDKFVVGISNCADLGVKEQHAMNLQAAFVDAEGYINVPFNYFKTPATWAKLFTKEELEKVVVVLVEYYGAEEDTEVTISDLRGYKELEKAGKEDVARLNDIVAKLQAFDIAGRYTDLVDAAAALDPLDNYTADYDDVYDQIFAVLEGYKDPAAAIVDVPGYSIYTQEELNQFPVRGGSATITKSGDGIKVVYQSKYRFANGIATGVGGYEEDDCEYGEVVAINGKTFIEMIGGYKLNQIFAYRFKIDGGTDYICINYKDGPGKYTGMTTKPQTAYIGSDGYYTFKTADVPVGKFDNWYEGNGYNLDADAIREHAKFILFDATKNQNKLIYGWQVILYETIDRSALKQALADYAELGVAGYDDALAAYYNKDATQKQVDDAAAALIDSATPDAPAAPTAAEVTYNSVTLTLGPDSIEYRMGENGEWSGQTEYTGLEPNTEYSFYARVASIGGLPASEPSKALVVKTLKAPIAGEIAIEGEAVYGKTLTATATVTTANPGDLTYTWLRGEAEVGTGTEYVLGKDDIGAALAVSVTAANLDGVLTSDPTAVVVKATPVITTAPADSVIMIGDKLSNAALTGGEVDVPGTWRWADPELVPALTQSGTAFPVIFTPEDTDCYNTVTAYVVVSITSDTEEKTVVDEKTGIK